MSPSIGRLNSWIAISGGEIRCRVLWFVTMSAKTLESIYLYIYYNNNNRRKSN